MMSLVDSCLALENTVSYRCANFMIALRHSATSGVEVAVHALASRQTRVRVGCVVAVNRAPCTRAKNLRLRKPISGRWVSICSIAFSLLA